MLQPVIPIKGIVGFVAVCTQPVGSLFTIKLFEHFCNFFRYFHEAIRCIEWVIVPQIDNSHIDLRFGVGWMSDRNGARWGAASRGAALHLGTICLEVQKSARTARRYADA